MKKVSKLQAKKKVRSAKSNSVSWSPEKAAALRKPTVMPSGGDCNCNCK